jgi:hypothetical protein
MKTNNLKHSISVNNSKVNCIVDIRLNDQCKNGHQDFAITGTFWEIGKNRSNNLISSGCCHDDILKHFPELKIFVDLHLCDYAGIPTYIIENGYFHMSIKEMTKEKFCEYYRITSNEYNALTEAKDKKHFGYIFYSLGILKRYKLQANEAIKQLEKLTGDTFICDSVKTQFNMSSDEINEVSKLVSSGFYDDKEITKRENEKTKIELNNVKKSLKEDYDKKIQNAKIEYFIQIFMLEKFGASFKNYIFYNHCNTLCFNWKSYEIKKTNDEIKTVFESLTIREKKLLQGLKITNNKENIFEL